MYNSASGRTVARHVGVVSLKTLPNAVKASSVYYLVSLTLLMPGELSDWINARQSGKVFFPLLILQSDLVLFQHTERCRIIRYRESGCASEIQFLAEGAPECCPVMFCRRLRPSREASC